MNLRKQSVQLLVAVVLASVSTAVAGKLGGGGGTISTPDITVVYPNAPIAGTEGLELVVVGVNFDNQDSVQVCSTQIAICNTRPTVFLDSRTLVVELQPGDLSMGPLALSLDENSGEELPAINFDVYPTDGTIAITPNTMFIPLGTSMQFSANSSIPMDTIVWSLNNSSVYSIDQTGKVTAPGSVGRGLIPYVRAQVTATSTVDPTKSTSITVTSF